MDLRRVAQDEVGGDRGDAVGAAERCLQREPFAVAEMLQELPHDADIRSGEPEYGLPVITHGEQLCAWRTVKQRLQQPRPVGRDVLELIDQDVAEWTAVAAGLDMLRGSGDHVVEIDLS